MNQSDLTINSDENNNLKSAQFNNQLSDHQSSASVSPQNEEISIFKQLKKQKSQNKDNKQVSNYPLILDSEDDNDEVGKELANTQSISSKIQNFKQCNSNSKNNMNNDKFKNGLSIIQSQQEFSKSQISDFRASLKQNAVLNNFQQINENSFKIQESVANLNMNSPFNSPLSKFIQNQNNYNNSNSNNQANFQNSVENALFEYLQQKKNSRYQQINSPRSIFKFLSKDQNQDQNNNFSAQFQNFLNGINPDNNKDENRNTIIDDQRFDVQAQFDYYFPHGNYSNILEKMEDLQNSESLRQVNYQEAANDYFSSFRDRSSSKYQSNLTKVNSEEFVKGQTVGNNTPFVKRKNILQTRYFKRDSEFYNKQCFRTKTQNNSKIQNLIKKFQDEENNNQSNNDQMQQSIDLQNQKIIRRQRQIMTKMTLVNIPKFRKFSKQETSFNSIIHSPGMSSYVPYKNKLDSKIPSMETSNQDQNQFGGTTRNQNVTLQSQQNEEDSFFPKYQRQGTPGRSPVGSKNYGNIFSKYYVDSIQDENNLNLQTFNKKSQFKSEANDLSD